MGIIELLQKKIRYKQITDKNTWEQVIPLLESIDHGVAEQVEQIKDNNHQKYLQRVEKIDAKIAQLVMGVDKIQY